MDNIATSTISLYNQIEQNQIPIPNDISSEILNQTLSYQENNQEAVIIDFSSASQTLNINIEELIKKINQLLKDKLPEGLESLKPEETTAEATATKVVSGITSMYENFKKSNPELSQEEMLEHFMKAARQGVDEGYSSASETLEELGAFTIDGVKSSIEQTKILITQKLDTFEESQKKQLTSSQVKSDTETAILTQVGRGLVA